jgi:hypothetical protein
MLSRGLILILFTALTSPEESGLGPPFCLDLRFIAIIFLGGRFQGTSGLFLYVWKILF